MSFKAKPITGLNQTHNNIYQNTISVGTSTSNILNRAVSFNESSMNNIDHISGLSPLATKTRCGKNVWVLYAKSSTNNSQSPIRVIIENGVRKMHLFDFICALTECSPKNVENEWETIEKSLENHILKKIRMSKFQFPELNCHILTCVDSMTIDIFQATKVALVIGKRTNLFNDRLASIGSRFFGGDLTLADDVEYMHEVQRSIGQVEPDNFLRLWGNEFSHNSTVVRQQQAISNPENILSEIAPMTRTVVAATTGIRRSRSRTRSIPRSRTRSIPRSQSRSDPGVVYCYLIIPVHQTREEAYQYIRENPIDGLEIPTDLPASVVISKDDLDGLFMIKAGRTTYTVEVRSNEYIRDLWPGLYQVEPLSACEYRVENGDLNQVESAMHADILKYNLSANEPIGLVSRKGEVTWTREVFKVNDIDAVSAQIRETVDNYQKGLSIQSSVDSYQESTSIKLRQIDVDREIKLKQIDAEKEIKLKQIESKTELFKMMLDRGISHDYIMQVFNSVS